jgi:hypothetical protein
MAPKAFFARISGLNMYSVIVWFPSITYKNINKEHFWLIYIIEAYYFL